MSNISLQSNSCSSFDQLKYAVCEGSECQEWVNKMERLSVCPKNDICNYLDDFEGTKYSVENIHSIFSLPLLFLSLSPSLSLSYLHQKSYDCELVIERFQWRSFHKRCIAFDFAKNPKEKIEYYLSLSFFLSATLSLSLSLSLSLYSLSLHILFLFFFSYCVLERCTVFSIQLRGTHSKTFAIQVTMKREREKEREREWEREKESVSVYHQHGTFIVH